MKSFHILCRTIWAQLSVIYLTLYVIFVSRQGNYSTLCTTTEEGTHTQVLGLQAAI